MYNYNNEDRSKEEGLNEWFSEFINTDTQHTTLKGNPHRRERDLYSTIRKLYNSLPTTSSKGVSQYHR